MRFPDLDGQRVLVTGAGGFIGSRLCSRLLENNAKVHGVSRKIPIKKEKDFQTHHVDLTNQMAVRCLLREIQPEIIFHLSSHVTGSRDLTEVLPTFDNNLKSTVHLLIEATGIKCQKVFITGSMEEPDPKDIDCIPCSPYAAAKWASSGYGRMFHALYQIPVIIMRVFMVYGPGQMDMKKLIPYVISSFLRKEAPELTSGTREVDWVYIDDVVDAFLRAAVTPGLEGKTLDIGSGNLVSVREIVERLNKIIEPGIKPRFGAIPERKMERILKADLEKTAQMMGWKPSVPLEEGLVRTVNWYKTAVESGEIQ